MHAWKIWGLVNLLQSSVILNGWYVNLDNNSLSHRPGMQEHHALTEYADPCFGKVVKVMASKLTLLFLLLLDLEGH
jgi:hypothetical protein